MARIAFEEISPRRGYPDFDAYIQELEKAFANKIKPELLKLFELQVARWKHKVDFRAVKRITPLEVSVYVYPTGPNKEIWLWVSGGTRAYTIIPKVAIKSGILPFVSIKPVILPMNIPATKPSNIATQTGKPQ